MEVDGKEPPFVEVAPPENENGKHNGLDSDDDETLRFEGEDDLYSSDLDDADARWVTKQHRPATEGGAEESAANGDSDGSEDTNNDEEPVGLPPEVAETDDTEGVTQKKGQGKKKGGRAMGVASDAQLSCPLCFTTVCLECQRHARYHNQFRAVTGINVVVKTDESLSLDEVSGGGKRPPPRSKKGAWSNSGAQSSARGAHGGNRGEGAGEETFHPVCCSECNHRVGVFDEEDVFHFFNVIASG